MRADIVIGANYGDEGKGTVVARLAKECGKALNILTNGGSQRGHSILTKEGSMTFQHFGSGTYHGADNYYSAWYILNPMQFVEEYDQLVRKPKFIYRDYHCRWSTPYDIMANLIEEEQRGRKASCGMGIWKTIERSNNIPSIPFDDFMAKPELWPLYFADVRRYYENRMTIPDRWRDLWLSNGIMRHFIADCKRMQSLTEAVSLESLNYEHLIFENGQGLLLSDTGKDTADTTPSDTGINYALSMIRNLGEVDVCAHYVTRPYLTRHGDGHIMGTTDRSNLSASVSEDRTNHYNEHQGAFRYGHLDITALCQRIKADARGIDFILDVTHCDEMDRITDFRRVFNNVNAIDTAMV